MNNVEESKPEKVKLNFRTSVLSLLFMVFILLLVTALMPHNEIIGICLQTLAGVIFILDQIWIKVVTQEDLGKIKTQVNEPVFLQKVAIISIPIIIPLLLIIYFKLVSDTKWYDAFLSISIASGISALTYLYFITMLLKIVKKLSVVPFSWAKRICSNPLLYSNLILLVVSFYLFIQATLIFYPFSHLGNRSIFEILPSAIYLTVTLFLAYGFLLSILYFVMFFLFRLGVALLKARLKIQEKDRNFIRRLVWIFLVVFWVWGGILLIISTTTS